MTAQTVIVREFAQLTTAQLAENTLDRAQISCSAFQWLIELGQQFKASGVPLLELNNQRSLKLDNYVGVLESPCGQVIEVLPKHTTEDIPASRARSVLKRLIQTSMQIHVRETGFADIRKFEMPMREWLVSCFLNELDLLVKRGLQFDYQVREEQTRYLRGQLDISKQLRQPLGRAHIFNIRHDLFLPNRAENRLLKTALVKVCKLTQDSDNWRLSHEVLSQLQQLPETKNIKADFLNWSNDRLLTHYRAVKPWCELILSQHVPIAIAGGTRGISMLFPMERLFESFVTAKLSVALGRRGVVKSQIATQHLCEHQGRGVFKLRPDIEMCIDNKRWILDVKWKLLDIFNKSRAYKLSEKDFYQVLAYGFKYLEGSGELVLIYPAWAGFPKDIELPYFHFDNQLKVKVIPFDLEGDGVNEIATLTAEQTS